MRNILFIIVFLFLVGCTSKPTNVAVGEPQYEMFDESGDTLVARSFKILQVFPQGSLAVSANYNSDNQYSGPVVFLHVTGSDFQEGDIVDVPKEEAAVQCGNLHYLSQDHGQVSVPIVFFLNKK